MFVELFVPNVSQQCIGDKIIKAVMIIICRDVLGARRIEEYSEGFGGGGG